MQKFRSLRKLFGFTKTGSSVLGEQARNALKKRWIHRGVGTGLVALVTSVVLIKNLANMGGDTVLAANFTVAKPIIDATTATTIQTPISFEYESRGFSWFHAGADLVNSTGTPVKPIMAGIVKTAAFGSLGYGNHVIVDHQDGLESLYAHLSKIDVSPGQNVDLSTVVGEVGSTGFSTGPHLHLEVRQNGQLINPADLVPGVN